MYNCPDMFKFFYYSDTSMNLEDMTFGKLIVYASIRWHNCKVSSVYLFFETTCMVKNQTFNYSIAEEDAVITAHLNEYACNPVLRGQSNATLQ